jgi:hypothetical protein
MKIDWDKESGEWRIFDESGVELACSPEVVIEGITVLVHDERERHGWAVAVGTIERQANRIVIKGNKHV